LIWQLRGRHGITGALKIRQSNKGHEHIFTDKHESRGLPSYI